MSRIFGRDPLGKNRFPPANGWVTVKKVNKELADYGYSLMFVGYEREWLQKTYVIYPIKDMFPVLKNKLFEVNDLGDFTPEEWGDQLVKRLNAQSPLDTLPKEGTKARTRRNQKIARRNK